MSEDPAPPSGRFKINHPTLVLGVDGGGTKTIAQLARIDKNGQPVVIGLGTAGSSNQVAIGLAPAMANLTLAIDQALELGHLSDSPIANAVFAIAGSGTAQAKKNILDHIEDAFEIGSARVVHDGQAALAAGTPDGWGIAFIAGTGAVAYGSDPTGTNSAVTGGWGYWFGDEGSAYWLGQSALRAISQAADGRATKTALTDAVLNRLQIDEPREILSTLANSGDTRLAIAELADLVPTTAQQQDEVANQILAAAAEHWSQHIRSLAQQLMPNEQFPLAIAGGVLCGSPIAREALLKQLAADQCHPITIQYVDEPVAGCTKLAYSDWQKQD